MTETDRNDRSERRYRVFDLRIRSNLPLAGLPESGSDEVDWRLAFQPSPISGGNWTEIHDWRDATGVLQLSCARNGPAYRLRFPDLAEFRIDFEHSNIRATAPKTTSEQTLGQLFLDQVLPRVLFHSGRLVVHASAVSLEDGGSVAFLGPSGSGKSTLAASYLASDATVLTDDCLLLRTGDAGLEAIAAYPALRLWPDSLAALGPESPEHPRTTLDSGKTRLSLDSPAQAARPASLSALFLLEDPAVAPDTGVTIAPLTGNRAMMSIIESAFVLDLASKDAIRQNFAIMSILARSKLPMFTLKYPRRYDLFSEIHDKVTETVAKCETHA